MVLWVRRQGLGSSVGGSWRADSVTACRPRLEAWPAHRRRCDPAAAAVEFARRWPERTWAIENANELGRLLARQLVDADQVVVDVPAKLAARVRTLSGAGHKTDAHDAVSTAIAGRHGTVLRPVVADKAPRRCWGC